MYSLTLMLALMTPVAGSTAAPPQRIAPGTFLLRGEFLPGRQPDGNSVILQAPDGLIVVDSGRHAAHAQRLLDFAATQRQPIAVVVNTHWHLDHIGGNARLRAAHPALRAHASNALDGALRGFLANSRKQLVQMLESASDDAQKSDMREEIARIDAGAALGPDEVIDAAGERTLAGRRVQLGFEADSVTAGDVWLFDPATRVLVAGDLVTLPAPFFDTACPARWQASLARLARVEFATLVPGHGAPMTRAEFTRYRTAFDSLLECAAGDGAAETCVQGWIDAAGPLLGGHPPGLTRGLVDYYVQQRLRGDGARQDCPARD